MFIVLPKKYFCYQLIENRKITFKKTVVQCKNTKDEKNISFGKGQWGSLEEEIHRA